MTTSKEIMERLIAESKGQKVVAKTNEKSAKATNGNATRTKASKKVAEEETVRELYNKVIEYGMQPRDVDIEDGNLYLLFNRISNAWLMTYPNRRKVKSFIANDGKKWYEVPFGEDDKKKK